MSITFFELPGAHRRLLPLTFAKPIAELRVGIMLIREKWEHYLGETQGYYTEDYLQEKFNRPKSVQHFLINGAVLPSAELAAAIKRLNEGEVLYVNGELMAAVADSYPFNEDKLKKISYTEEVSVIRFPWDIFRINGDQIWSDYKVLTDGRQSQVIADPHTITYGTEVFIEEEVTFRNAVLNAEDGPIYIGKNALVEENSVIHGPFALGEGSQVKLGGKMRSDTTIGPGCKVGGEISNSVLQGFTNKGHEGFLGNSVLGEWCNLGADTNTSNLKNNYSRIKLWDYGREDLFTSELQFCGLMMGDHSKCGIDTMFNTGTSVGFCSSVFGGGFTPKFVPSYTWGGIEDFHTYDLDKAMETAERVMTRRNKNLEEIDERIFHHIFTSTAKHRHWEPK